MPQASFPAQEMFITIIGPDAVRLDSSQRALVRWQGDLVMDCIPGDGVVTICGILHIEHIGHVQLKGS